MNMRGAARKVGLAAMLGLGVVIAGWSWLAGHGSSAASAAAAAPEGSEKPALTVTQARASVRRLPTLVQASGAITAWQEGSIGARVSGLPVVAVEVNVGDRVHKGQVLARLDDALVRTELTQAQANLAAAQAAARQAAANRDRALALKSSGALSEQDILQSTTLASTGEAQVAQARATLQAVQLKLRYTVLEAPDDGVISARTAALGLIAQSGTEMFRFIRQGRLEWRAELTATQVSQVQNGQEATVRLPGGAQVTGKVRQVAPQLSADTRLALAYVDLDPASVTASGARAGMFASGDIRRAQSDAITVPADSIVIRDGRSFVMRLTGTRAHQAPVNVGRRAGEVVEILSGLAAGDAVVLRGAGFVNDNDTVRIVEDGSGSAPRTAGGPS